MLKEEDWILASIYCRDSSLFTVRASRRAHTTRLPSEAPSLPVEAPNGTTPHRFGDIWHPYLVLMDEDREWVSRGWRAFSIHPWTCRKGSDTPHRRGLDSRGAGDIGRPRRRHGRSYAADHAGAVWLHKTPFGGGSAAKVIDGGRGVVKPTQ